MTVDLDLQNAANTIALLADTIKPQSKRPGIRYTDSNIPAGHAHITYFPIPYSDETEEHQGRVLHEGDLFICIDLGSGESWTVPKRDTIITRGTAQQRKEQ